MKNTAKFTDGIPEILPIAASFFKSVAIGLIAAMLLWSLGTAIEIFVREIWSK